MTDLGNYSDSELITLLRSGDRESELAFNEVYRRYSRRIYAYCKKMVKDTEDCNDVYQDVFMKFYKEIGRGLDSDNIISTLLMIARSRILNFYRDRKNLTPLDNTIVYSDEKHYEDKEIFNIIAKSLDKLDFSLREAFVLRQYQGMSYKEMSKITGETINCLKNRFWRAKEKIKVILQPYLEEYQK